MPWPKKQSFDEGDSLFPKKDEIIKFRLIDKEPELYYVHRVESSNKKCGGPECAFCTKIGEDGKALYPRSQKGSMLVMDLTDGQQKKLRGSGALFMSIWESIQMSKESGSEATAFSVKATGEKSARRYHVMPISILANAKPVDTDEAPF